MIEALEKLRGLRGNGRMYEDVVCEAAHLADVIQAEIDSKYFLLPVDAEGVPIRPGDTLKHVTGGFTFTADTLEIDRWGAHVRPNGQARVQCANCLHHNPRTIEDVLRDFGWECVNNCGADPDDIASCADEIRELMEND